MDGSVVQQADPVIAPRFAEGMVSLQLNAQAYSLLAVQKTSYAFASRCVVIIGPATNDILPLSLVFPPTTTEAEALDVTRRFMQDLLDQELREKIGEETRAIRSLVLAHAFSRTNLIRRD